MRDSEDFVPTGIDDPRIKKVVIHTIRLSELSDEAIEKLVAISWKHNIGIVAAIEKVIMENCPQ